MNKTQWRQTDIRDFLCKHEYENDKPAMYSLDTGNGFGTIMIGYRCVNCNIVKKEKE